MFGDSTLVPTLAAAGGYIVGFDWPALTPALTQIRLLAALCRLAASSQLTVASGHWRLGLVVAVQFAPTGALPAGAPHDGVCAA